MSAIGGFMLGLVAIAMKLLGGFDLTGNPLLYASLFGVMVGLQFTLMGMTAEMSTRTHYESQEPGPTRCLACVASERVQRQINAPAANSRANHRAA